MSTLDKIFDMYNQFIFNLGFIFVVVVVLIELAHAYKSKSIRTLWNLYTLGFVLVAITIFLRKTVIQFTLESPRYVIIYHVLIVEYSLLYLVDAYGLMRFMPLMDLLFGDEPSEKTVRQRLWLFRFILWFGGVVIIIHASKFIYPWIVYRY